MQNLDDLLKQAQQMIKNQQRQIQKLNEENENLSKQLIALKNTDWLIENENLSKENKSLQKEITQARDSMTRAQALASEASSKQSELEKQIEHTRDTRNQLIEKHRNLNLYINKKATEEGERLIQKEKKELEGEYRSKRIELRNEYQDLKEKLWKIGAGVGIAIVIVAVVIGFMSHAGRVKWQQHRIDKLEQKLDTSENTISKQEKRIDKLSTPDQATLERKINAIDGVGYVLQDPVISKSARDAASKFVNKEELQELRSELDKSRKAGKVGWWSYEVLKTKLTASENYVS